MTPGLGIEPGPYWWEASALTTAPFGPCSLDCRSVFCHATNILCPVPRWKIIPSRRQTFYHDCDWSGLCQQAKRGRHHRCLEEWVTLPEAVKKTSHLAIVFRHKLCYLIPMHSVHMWSRIWSSAFRVFSCHFVRGFFGFTSFRQPNFSRLLGKQTMKVLLQDKELWQKFRELRTEMMITNSGRYVCCLSIFWLINWVHLEILFPLLCSWHKKRHQCMILATLNFLWGWFTRSLAFKQPNWKFGRLSVLSCIWCNILVINLRNALQ